MKERASSPEFFLVRALTNRHESILRCHNRRYWRVQLRLEAQVAVRHDTDRLVAIDNRNAEEVLLPIARDRGIATLVNGPFGRTRLFRRVGDRTVPEWAQDFGANSWAQFFLKWLLGNPTVTFPIPATSDPKHLEDNMGAGIGRVPNEDELKRMADFIDALPQVERRRRGG